MAITTNPNPSKHAMVAADVLARSCGNVAKWMEWGLFVVTSYTTMMVVTIVVMWIAVYDEKITDADVVPLVAARQ